MLWTSEQGYGSTYGQPWLPFSAAHVWWHGGRRAQRFEQPAQHHQKTADAPSRKRDSIRRRFSLGPRHPSVLSYCRSSESNSLWVYMNFSEHAVRATLPPNPGAIIFSTRAQRRHRTVSSITIQLQAYEALIIEGCNAAAATSNLASAHFSSANRSAQSDHASLTARYPGFVADGAAA
jgi:hypothetical protein